MKRLLLALALISTNVFASTLTIVTTSGPGSLSDQAARFLQPLLAKELGVDVVVTNAPGGNGVVGFRAFNQLSGDHILIGSFAVPFVAKTLPQKDFDPISEFVPVVGLTHAPMNILVPAKSPVKDVAGLVALSKANNGLKGGTAHPSANASMHILDKTIGTNTQQINYKQITQLYTDLSSGILDYAFGGATSSAAALVQSGHLRSLGRLDQTGVPDFSWTALFVKAGNENGKVAQAAKKVVTAENMAALPQPFFRADAATLRGQLLREYALIPTP